MLSDLFRMHKSCLVPAIGFIFPVVSGSYITRAQDKSATLMSLVNKGIFQYSFCMQKTICIQIFILILLLLCQD